MDETLIPPISATWSSCDIRRQCQLIRIYLLSHGRIDSDNWLQFLTAQFALAEGSPCPWSGASITEEDIYRQFEGFEHDQAPTKSAGTPARRPPRPRSKHFRPGPMAGSSLTSPRAAPANPGR